MDSSTNPPTTSTNGETSMVVQTKRAKFLSTYYRQEQWSLPDAIIYYILKHPPSAKMYEKLIKTCKYFFKNNPILLITSQMVQYEKHEWFFYHNDANVALSNFSSSFWILNKFDIPNPTIFHRITDAATCFYFSYLHLSHQSISFNDFLFISEKCEKMTFVRVTVKNMDGTIAPLEKIIAGLHSVTHFEYLLDENSAIMITSNTVKQLIDIPQFKVFHTFELRGLPEVADLDILYDYITENTKTKFRLSFDHGLSQQYKNRLHEIVKKIYDNYSQIYRLPYIYYSGIDDRISDYFLKNYNE